MSIRHDNCIAFQDRVASGKPVDKVMFSKKAGTACKKCSKAIEPGQKIVFHGWQLGASHVDCARPNHGARKGMAAEIRAAEDARAEAARQAAVAEAARLAARVAAAERARLAARVVAERALADMGPRLLPPEVRLYAGGRLESPYHAGFVALAREAGASWDAASRRWSFASEAEARLAAYRAYGETQEERDARMEQEHAARAARYQAELARTEAKVQAAIDAERARLHAGETVTIEQTTWPPPRRGARIQHHGVDCIVVGVGSRPMTRPESEWEEDAGQSGLEDVAVLEIRLATPALLAEIEAGAAAARRREEILAHIVREGELPEHPRPDSAPLPPGEEVLWQSRHATVLGGGSYVLIAEDGYVYRVLRYHMDGDDWSRCNYAGCIAHRIPRTDALVEDIRQVEAVLRRDESPGPASPRLPASSGAPGS